MNNTAIIEVGTRIYSDLYSYGRGTVVAVRDCNTGSCQSMGGGIMVTGGGHVDIIFDSGAQSDNLPECILRGVQWQILEDEPLADAEEIAQLVARAERHRDQQRAEKKAEDETRAEAVDRMRNNPEYSHLDQIGRQHGATEVAKNVRKDLKKHFPGVKFSVRKEGYDCIKIRWEDGPTQKQVDAVVQAYKAGHFNGMEDYYEYDFSPFNEIYGGVKYVFTNRDYTDSLVERAIRKVISENRGYTAPEMAQYRKGELFHEYPKGDPDSWQTLIHLAIAEIDAREPEEEVPEEETGDNVVSMIEKAQEMAHPEGFKPGTRGAESLGDYEDRVQARAERAEARADKARAQSEQFFQRSHDMVSNIPLGQPILVGHHSERRHRNTLDKSWNLMGKAVEADKKADHYQSKAAGVGTAGIASDDVHALEKLREKLEGLEKAQAMMKAANSVIRKHKTEAEQVKGLMEMGFTEAQATEVIKPDFCGRVGFAAYSLSNNNAEIRRCKARIEELEQLHNAEPVDIEGDGWLMFENDGRICLEFDDKPDADIRKLCKAAGFRWAPSRSAWVRKITPNAVGAAKELAKKLPQPE